MGLGEEPDIMGRALAEECLPQPTWEALLCSSSYILVGTESRNAEKRHPLSWCLEKQCREWNEDEVVPTPLLTSHGALEPSFLICAEVVIMRA